MVIPLTRRKQAIQLTEQVMRIIGMDGKPNNITVNNDTSTVEKLLKQIVMLSDKGNKLTDALIQTVSSQDNNLGSNDAIRGLEKYCQNKVGIEQMQIIIWEVWLINAIFCKIIDGYKEEVITDFNQLIFLDARAESPNTNDNSVTINGVDGILPGAISFAPFSLVLRFGYDGIDVIDLNLFEHWFRSVFNRRHPYYVITSQMHGVKYAVNTANVTSNLKMVLQLKLK